MQPRRRRSTSSPSSTSRMARVRPRTRRWRARCVGRWRCSSPGRSPLTAIEDVPVSQLERGFVEEDAFSAAGLDHILLSHNYETTSVVNGVTTDPDLRAVERGPGANQMRFVFDEGVSVPTGILDPAGSLSGRNCRRGAAVPRQHRSLAGGGGRCHRHDRDLQQRALSRSATPPSLSTSTRSSLRRSTSTGRMPTAWSSALRLPAVPTRSVRSSSAGRRLRRCS
jgi:hypothetical protein